MTPTLTDSSLPSYHSETSTRSQRSEARAATEKLIAAIIRPMTREAMHARRSARRSRRAIHRPLTPIDEQHAERKCRAEYQGVADAAVLSGGERKQRGLAQGVEGQGEQGADGGDRQGAGSRLQDGSAGRP